MRGDVRGVVETEEWTSGRRTKAFQIGDRRLFRTVTMYQLGEIVGQDGHYLVLGDASWVANTGPFGKALETGQLEEFEPVNGPVIINLDAIIDVYDWRHPLPRPSGTSPTAKKK